MVAYLASMVVVVPLVPAPLYHYHYHYSIGIHFKICTLMGIKLSASVVCWILSGFHSWLELSYGCEKIRWQQRVVLPSTRKEIQSRVLEVDSTSKQITLISQLGDDFLPGCSNIVWDGCSLHHITNPCPSLDRRTMMMRLVDEFTHPNHQSLT